MRRRRAAWLRRSMICAGDRMQRFGPTIDEVANRNIALGDPRPLIEQSRGLEERRKIDLDKFAAEALDPPQHLGEEPLALCVAEKFKLARREARRSARL